MNSTIPIPARVCSIFACPNNVWRPVFSIFNTVNMMDPIRKRFGYGQLWPLRPVCSQNRAGSYNYAGSDFPHLIQFRSSKEGLDHNLIVQNRAGSDLNGLFRVLPNASGPEAGRCARIIGPGSGRTQPASFQFLHFQTWLRSFTDGSDHIVQNQLGSDLVLVDCQVLARRIRSGSKPVCKNHIRPASGYATLPIRSGSGPACLRDPLRRVYEIRSGGNLFNYKIKIKSKVYYHISGALVYILLYKERSTHTNSGRTVRNKF